ncbi:MAG: SMC-Scp complex subunit ScpB [Candidatus Melainabacteria bacterium]|nr:SMC-Scp complex subunit ScpB [Candidatus Melainabacteria bacterium]
MANDLLKAQIEAALFLSDKPMKAANVARIVNADVDVVRQLIIELIHDYEARNGGLEVSDDDGYIIQVKDEYTNLVDEFVPIDMPTALIRTLSAIAIKQPVMQSEVIKIRGAGAYDHIKELVERELINKREEGRSPILTTTKKFQEYFRLSKDGKHFRTELSGEDGVAKDLPFDDASLEGDDLVFATAEAAAVNSAAVFDASPDPDSPSIGMPASEQVNESKATTGEAKQDSSGAFIDSSSTSETTTLQ